MSELNQTDRLKKLLFKNFGSETEPAKTEDKMRTFTQPNQIRPDKIHNINSSSSRSDAFPRSETKLMLPAPVIGVDRRASNREFHSKSLLNQNSEYEDYSKFPQYSNIKKDEPTTVSSDEFTKFTSAKPIERHTFTKIVASSFVACSCPQGYSEITLTFVLDSKTLGEYSMDKHRVIINMLYDAEDDLWSVSGKIVKRANYNSKDEDKMVIFNRSAFTHELKKEIKRMLLVFNVSPRDAYRFFRRDIAENFVIGRLDYGFVSAECESHAKVMKDLEKTGYSQYQEYYGHG